VVDSHLEGAADRGLEVDLCLRVDLGERLVVPAILVAHSPAGEERHLQLCSTEAPVLHGAIVGSHAATMKNNAQRVNR
jgi:hypothetical protein